MLLAVLAVGFLLHRLEVFDVIFSSDLAAEEKVSRVKEFFESYGHAAPAMYFLLVAIEVVVAPIPGTMLYAPGGVVFGGFWGGLLALAGNVAGAAVACQLVRILGPAVSDRVAQRESITALQERLARHGVLVVFLLRINPLTSSDLVSYAAGLTRMPVWKLCAGTALGMAPLCWAQAYMADGLLSAFPSLVYPLVALCGVYAATAIAITWRMVWQRPRKDATKRGTRATGG